MTLPAPSPASAHLGLSRAEVAQRETAGQVNAVPTGPSRTVGQIIRANVFTVFNLILGALLVLVLVVAPIQDALFGVVLITKGGEVGLPAATESVGTLARITARDMPQLGVLHLRAIGGDRFCIEQTDVRPDGAMRSWCG
jgi:hypothetical protein